VINLRFAGRCSPERSLFPANQPNQSNAAETVSQFPFRCQFSSYSGIFKISDRTS